MQDLAADNRARPGGAVLRATHGAGRTAVAGPLLAVLLLAALTACAGREADLPDFPYYDPADAYLQMQARQQAYEPPQPQPYPYTARNQHIFARLQRDLRYSRAELELRARQREEGERRARAPRHAGFEALQLRQAHDQVIEALRARERAAYLGQAYQRAERELSEYQARLERLTQAQQESERQRGEDEVRYRAPDLEVWEAVRLRVASGLARQVLQEQLREENRRRAHARSNTGISDYQARVERLRREQARREQERERMAEEARVQAQARMDARLRQQEALLRLRGQAGASGGN